MEADATEEIAMEGSKYWKMPVPPECIQFVDSSDSEPFALFLLALRNAIILAMDAEWKPIHHKSVNTGNPRVSILQVACRYHLNAGGFRSISVQGGNLGAGTEDSDRKSGVVSSVNGDEGFCNGDDDHDRECIDANASESEIEEEGDQAGLETKVGRKGWIGRKNRFGNCQEVLTARESRESSKQRIGKDEADVEGQIWREMIFLLDLTALPVATFCNVLKEALVDPMVLKLGFGFKQDLVNLRSTFPGPESQSCFDKVDPYLDVGRLYRHLHTNPSSHMHRGKREKLHGDGLASICDTVLGLPLSKDMQCSNWEQRPLTLEQLNYAAADAYCLLAIFDALQVKVSDSWFAPEGDANIFWSHSKVGVAEALCSSNVLSPECFKTYEYASASICLPKRGTAMAMVEAGLGENSRTIDQKKEPDSLLTRSKPLSIEKLVRRFGEKLLVTGGDSTSKRLRRKTRSRRAQESGKSKELQDQEDVQWVGPPPWDSAVGGDGIPKFLCDAMVEGLARQLRCVGIDAASSNSKKCEPRELVEMAEKEGRILLTRDIKLLRRRLVPASLAYRVKRQGKWDQLAEVIETFKLSISEEQLLTRCTKCNGDFIPQALTAKEAVAQAPWSQVIPACALKNVDEFWQCSVCKHVYWQGYQFVRAYKQFASVCLTKS